VDLEVDDISFVGFVFVFGDLVDPGALQVVLRDVEVFRCIMDVIEEVVGWV